MDKPTVGEVNAAGFVQDWLKWPDSRWERHPIAIDTMRALMWAWANDIRIRSGMDAVVPPWPQEPVAADSVIADFNYMLAKRREGTKGRITALMLIARRHGLPVEAKAPERFRITNMPDHYGVTLSTGGASNGEEDVETGRYRTLVERLNVIGEKVDRLVNLTGQEAEARTNAFVRVHERIAGTDAAIAKLQSAFADTVVAEEGQIAEAVEKIADADAFRAEMRAKINIIGDMLAAAAFPTGKDI